MDKAVFPISLFFALLFGTHAYLCIGQEAPKAETTESSATVSETIVADDLMTNLVPKVRAFIDAYCQDIESANLDSLMQKYAEEVDYYAWGKVPKDLIRQEKAEYFARWPQVSLDVAGNIELLALPENNQYFVSYLVNFSVHNPDKSYGAKRISGQARHIWHLHKQQGFFSIILEKQKVMYRQRAAS